MASYPEQVTTRREKKEYIEKKGVEGLRRSLNPPLLRGKRVGRGCRLVEDGGGRRGEGVYIAKHAHDDLYRQ